MSTPNRLVLPLVLHLKLVLIALAVAMGIAGGALAQPANDRFANRTTIALPGSATGTTVGATVEQGQPDLANSTGRAMVWWTVTPRERGRMTIDTCNSGQRTFLGVYTGSALGGLTRVGQDWDRSGCANGGRLTFHTEAGVAYQIGVAAITTAGSVRVNVGLVASPSNDLFQNRTRISELGAVFGTNVAATAQSGQPDLAGSTGRAMVWWTYTAPVRGRLTIDTCDSGQRTYLGVYRGSTLGGLTRVGQDWDRSGCANGGRVTFHTEAGVAYQIGVAAISTEGSVRVNVGLVASPGNDLFQDRTRISDLGTVTGTTVAATAQSGQPILGGSSGRPMVWWTFTAAQRGRLTIDTCGSGQRSYLGVYTGGALGGLTRVGQDWDRSGCANGGRVTFHTEVGTVYQIAVAQITIEGSVRVSVGLEPSPGNDLFANRIAIPDLRTVVGTNVAATREGGQPDLAGSTGRPMVWWTYTAPERGRLTFDTCGSGVRTYLGVYTGGALGGLTRVGQDWDRSGCTNGGRVTFHTEAGAVYQIGIAGINNAEGPIRLAVGLVPSPANDLFERRAAINALGVVTGDNTAATVQTGQPDLAGSTGRPVVWWTYRATHRGRMTIETCGSGVRTHLGVYTGSARGAMTRVGQDWDRSGCANGGRVVFHTEPGVNYQIAVAGINNAEGAIRLTLGQVRSPANDLFADRAAIGHGGTVLGTNVAATVQASQPDLAGSTGRPLVWWSYRAPSSGDVSIQTCGSSMPTYLGVYTGSVLGSLTRVGQDWSRSGCQNGGRVTFAATGGVTYVIAVAGVSAEGHIVLAVAPPAGRVQTTTALTGPAASTQGQPVTLTATVNATAGTPTGRVSFRIGAQEIAAGNLNAQGVVSATISTLPAGQHQIAAIYQGAGNFQPSGSGFLTHTVAASNSATMLSGPSNSDPGDRVTFTATVNSGAGVPTGTVSFRREGVQFATGTLNAQGVATTSTTGLSVGRQQITAHYLGAGLVRPSASVPLIHTVLGAAVDTTTSLSGPASSTSGQSVSFTAQVRAASGTPGGTVSFRQGGTQFATGTLNAQGNVTVSVNTLPVGTLQITAHYLGGQGFNPSASAPLSHRVDSGAVDTTTTLTGPASVLQGQPAAFTARVAATAGTPTGTVSFRRDGAQFATGALNAQGVATTSVSNLPLGTHTITAHYLGATGFRASASGPLGVNVVHPRPDFSGGGAIFALTDQCAPILGSGPHAVGIHYAPSELGGLPSGVSLVWREGSEHLALWGPMLPSGNFFGAAGRATWSRFVFYPLRPLVRVVQRQITVPAGGTNLVQAEELVLRMRVQNFAAVPGCAVTVAATVRRNAVQEQAVEPVRLFSIGNIAAVSNGPTRPSEFTVTRSVMMTRLQTYHWNSARGSTPGTIGLQRLSPDTATLGPWQASGQPGMGGVPNANWIVEQRMILPPGRYRVVDSNPATWSHNAQSNNMGFFELWGYELD